IPLKFTWVHFTLFGGRTLSTKVMGLRILLEATHGDDLELLCLFSSVAARSGNRGQSDYALSNETLHRVAAAEWVRRKGRCQVRSIGWGPWEAGMVTPSVRTHFEARGIPLISLKDGGRAFVREVGTGREGDVEVLLGAGPEDSVRSELGIFERQFVMTPSRFPFLESHRIRGRVVLPVVLAMEWFMSTARDLFPALEVASCEDVRVLKGVVLAWEEREEHFCMRCWEFERIGARTVVSLELLGKGGVRHYTARVTLVARSSNPGKPELPRASDEALHEGERAAAAYQCALFHGPHFQAIQALGPSSPVGLSGTLRGAGEMGWEDDSFVLDVPLIDGGLQMARVWGFERLGQATLPTRIGSFQLFQPGFIQGPVQAVLRVDAHDALRISSTVTWQDARGGLIAIMDGFEVHVTTEELTTST
ncbi:MAG: KR domain-containing protein, partial [Pseudomonadota bacterium]